MAKNKGFASFEDVENDKPTKEIMKDADLKTNNKKNNGGRKPKEVKADKLIRVYITSEQKELLESHCSQVGMTESAFIRHLLIKDGVF